MSALHDQELADTLQAERLRAGLTKDAPVIPMPRRGHCIYCGGPTQGRACPSHKDLLQHDPYFARATTQATTPNAGAK